MRKGCRYEGGKEVRQRNTRKQANVTIFGNCLVDEETGIRDEWWKVIAKQRPAHEEHTSVHHEEFGHHLQG